MQAVPAQSRGAGNGGLVRQIIANEKRAPAGERRDAHETVERRRLTRAAQANFQRRMGRLQKQPRNRCRQCRCPFDEVCGGLLRAAPMQHHAEAFFLQQRARMGGNEFAQRRR